jgi:hypothetical protein
MVNCWAHDPKILVRFQALPYCYYNNKIHNAQIATLQTYMGMCIRVAQR